VCQKEEHPRCCAAPQEPEGNLAPGWPPREKIGSRERKTRAEVLKLSRRVRREEILRVPPQQISSPSGQAGPGSNPLPPEVAVGNPGRSPRVTVAAEGVNALWGSAWRWLTTGPGVPVFCGSPAGPRWRLRLACEIGHPFAAGGQDAALPDPLGPPAARFRDCSTKKPPPP